MPICDFHLCTASVRWGGVTHREKDDRPTWRCGWDRAAKEETRTGEPFSADLRC